MKFPALTRKGRAQPADVQTPRSADLEKASPGSAISESGWRRLVSGFVELLPGDWQKARRPSLSSVQQFPPVARCRALITGDVSKMRVQVMQAGKDGVAQPITSRRNPYYRTLKNPNPFQNRKEFIDSLVGSLCDDGNAYALKVRDGADTVRELWPINPGRCDLRIAPGGRAFYSLGMDDMLPAWAQNVVVPASEIVHLRINTIYHPLVGMPPLMAACLSGQMGVQIQEASSEFFGNSAAPSGALVAEESISPEEAAKHSEEWNAKFSGSNRGRVAILGGGLKWVPFSVPSRDAQLAEQLKLSAQMVGIAYGISEWKMGLTAPPAFNNAVQSLNLIYLMDTLQNYIEVVELGLTHGLEMPEGMFVELNTDDLLRMDQATQMEVVTKGAGGPVLTIDEGRRRIGLGQTPGGDTIYRQQQDHSLAALARRDELAPAGSPPPGASDAEQTKKALEAMQRGFAS